ncbi:MAG: FAD-binding domain-containing protein [Snowella sp.]|nr:FAD-binding domain-containing protein [Snowella sp.]
MSDLILFWHRRDLRISDNIGLSQAYKKSHKIIACFCLDLQILQADNIAPARVTYLWGCLTKLRQRYQQLGSQLLILQGDPTICIPQLAEVLNVNVVVWNLDGEPYAQKRDQSVAEQLRAKKIGVQTYWDQLLQAPGSVLAQGGKPYTVYTPFWKNWIQHPKAAIAETPDSLKGLNEEEQERIQQFVIDLPSLQDLGFNWDKPLLLDPGETAAQERLDFFAQNKLRDYQEQRNFPAIDGTSQLSAALKFGAIGIRTVWQASVTAMENSRSEEESNSIRTWQQELAWREFYQHCLYFFPELVNGPYRPIFKNFPWENNEEHFQAWCEGKTGYPIVDAAMRQMLETGWMHNRCRMIVASFLTKDLIINWQWGEKYFMQCLYDGDLAANNGGWQWSASSGMDPKPLRIFNPMTQAQKFDPEAEYIRHWLPELRSLDTEALLTGKITRLERLGVGYPEPIVDHNRQQREFKLRYANVKTGL